MEKSPFGKARDEGRKMTLTVAIEGEDAPSSIRSEQSGRDVQKESVRTIDLVSAPQPASDAQSAGETEYQLPSHSAAELRARPAGTNLGESPLERASGRISELELEVAVLKEQLAKQHELVVELSKKVDNHQLATERSFLFLIDRVASSKAVTRFDELLSRIHALEIHSTMLTGKLERYTNILGLRHIRAFRRRLRGQPPE